MSSEQQTRGDGGRRQIDRAENYAKAHGLTLDRTLDMADHGLSGFDGSNLERGQLGKFVELVRAGKIEKGSVLIVESLDRLSRAKARQSLRTFLELLDSGITITTLIDGRTYSEDSDHAELMVSLGVMQRAHDESRTKSDRGHAAWANKRKNASTKILTRCCPGWLRPKADRSGFETIKSRAKIVERIFAETIELGLGVNAINRRLNRDKIPPFGSAKAWQQGYIHKILRSRTVLGEFMPNSKGKPTEPVPGYYPRIISDEVFYRAAAAIESRRQGGGGRKGALISNLFTKLVFCGWCGHRVLQKGGRHWGRVLYCDGAHRGLGCSAVSWRYEKFEESFLRLIEEVDLTSLTGEAVSQTETRSIEGSLRATEGRLLESKRRRDQAFELILGTEPTDYLKVRLRELDGEVAALEQHLIALREKLKNLNHESEAFTRGKAEIAEMIKQVQSGADDTFAIRSALSARLRDVIGKIFVWSGPVRIDVGMGGKITHEIADRCYSVVFKNGINKLITPTVDDPARVVRTSDGRIVGSHPGVREEVTRQYQADPKAWEDVVLIEPVG